MDNGLPQIYKALADESRLRILHMLSFGSFNAQEITKLVGGSQPTVSHHLKVLAQAKLLEARKEGTWIYYSMPTNGDDSLPCQIGNQFVSLIRAPSLNGAASAFKKDTQIINKLLAKRRDDGKRFFDSVAKEWKTLREKAPATLPGQSSSIEPLARKIPSTGALLELGCGSGSLLERVLPRSGRTLGVDYSPVMLDEARANLGDLNSQVDLRLGYLEHLPIEDSSIDYCAAYMVFHHLAVPFDALRDAARVLKPNGMLLIVDLLRHDEEYMRSRLGDLWLGFDPTEFRQWVSGAGFSESSFELLGEKKDVFMLTAKRK